MQNNILENNRKLRMKEHEALISELTNKCQDIDKEFEGKEKEIVSYFDDLEKKLKNNSVFKT